jgi:hypothetical protein
MFGLTGVMIPVDEAIQYFLWHADVGRFSSYADPSWEEAAEGSIIYQAYVLW